MEFILKTTFSASAKDIYTAWLSSEGHSSMTGGTAEITNLIGENFTAWNGYIEGKNLELEPNKRILQSWRTSEFNENEADSRLEILFNEIGEEAELTLVHSNLPADGDHYKKGWDEHYFQPMKTYFSR